MPWFLNPVFPGITPLTFQRNSTVFSASLLRQMPLNHPMSRTSCARQP